MIINTNAIEADSAGGRDSYAWSISHGRGDRLRQPGLESFVVESHISFRSASFLVPPWGSPILAQGRRYPPLYCKAGVLWRRRVA